MAHYLPDSAEAEAARAQQSLRRWLGVIGLSLPLVLSLSRLTLGEIERSISAYYYVPYLGHYMSAAVFAVGIFLITYTGYPDLPPAYARLPAPLRWLLVDRRVTTLAGIGALVTALIPTCQLADLCEGNDAVNAAVHLAGAVTFLGLLGVMSMWSFTASDQNYLTWDLRKRLSNRLYRLCGMAIFAAIILCGITLWQGWASLGPLTDPVFWLESLAVTAFSLAWLVKGEADRPARAAGLVLMHILGRPPEQT